MEKQPYSIYCPRCKYRLGDGYEQRMSNGQWHVTITMSTVTSGPPLPSDVDTSESMDDDVTS